MIDRQWWIENNNRIHAEFPDDGLEVAKARDALIDHAVYLVEQGIEERPPAPTLREQMNAEWSVVIPTERRHRRDSFRKDAQYLIDAIHGDTILGEDDPLLAQPFPLGNGSDKTLRHWTRDDWTTAVTERYRNAATVTAAASEFDNRASIIIEAMMARGVQHTGDLFTA